MTAQPYQIEFPEYPALDFTIPAGFADESWRNEACPCFYSAAHGLRLWTDFPDAAERDWPGAPRFTLISDCETVDLRTDDMTAVTAAIEAFATRSK